MVELEITTDIIQKLQDYGILGILVWYIVQNINSKLDRIEQGIRELKDELKLNRDRDNKQV